jgi:hypothetical protein
LCTQRVRILQIYPTVPPPDQPGYIGKHIKRSGGLSARYARYLPQRRDDQISSPEAERFELTMPPSMD